MIPEQTKSQRQNRDFGQCETPPPPSPRSSRTLEPPTESKSKDSHIEYLHSMVIALEGVVCMIM